MLLDPPCSGLGTLSRNPDLRWRMSPRRIEGLLAEQERLLAAAEALRGRGGRLVYSICTLNPAEERLPDGEITRTWPHKDDTDGFYISRAMAEAAQPRAELSGLPRALAAAHEPPRPLPLRLLPAPLRADVGVSGLRGTLHDRAHDHQRDHVLQHLRRQHAAARLRPSP